MKHLLKPLCLILATAPLSAVQAQNMPVSKFIATAEGLQKKGPLALFSGEKRLLLREIDNSARQLRAEQAAANKVARKSATCMPEKITINSGELWQHLRSIPVTERGMNIKTAFAGYMRKKYPCPA